jgi:hypothetical protein
MSRKSRRLAKLDVLDVSVVLNVLGIAPKIKSIAEFIDKYAIDIVIPDGLSADYIIKVLNGYKTRTPKYYGFRGIYYRHVEKNYDLMKKYYLMAIEQGCVQAICNLGRYYQHIEKNYDLMKKYYLMAIELNYYRAMSCIGYYYQMTEINYELMKKYYITAIEQGNDAIAMNNLGYYYHDAEINYDLMKKYYLMAIELGDLTAMINLGNYYADIELNNELTKKYYLMAYKRNDLDAMINLGNYYHTKEPNYELCIKYYKQAVEHEKMSETKIIIGLRFMNLKNWYISQQINYKIPGKEETNEIKIMRNKINLSSKIQKCPICLEEGVKCIPYDCCHYNCIQCYIQIKTSTRVCPICRLCIG